MHSKVRNTLTPVWDEEFDFAVSPHAMTEELGISFEIVGLRVAVYDSDGPFNSFSGSNDFMGGAALDIAGQKHGRAISHELELGGILTRKASGRKPRLTIAITIYRDHVPRPPPRQLMLRQSLVHVSYIQQVYGVVVKAADLPNTEMIGLSDPFCIVRAVLISGQVVELHRTKVVNDTLKPVWQEAFQAAFTELDQPLLLLFDLWDEDDPSKPLDDGGAQHLGSAVAWDPTSWGLEVRRLLIVRCSCSFPCVRNLKPEASLQRGSPSYAGNSSIDQDLMGGRICRYLCCCPDVEEMARMQGLAWSL
ncbi:MCTP1 [Symbiodinium natans]|uniref:MCTP1 protein n=1 Tax=Symbiodinium natans TaxID=878477 RepID=A0A812KRN5_9DINO|nr:MCTP1 [Symbiodinium natans]